jgi:hypothetical protein
LKKERKKKKGGVQLARTEKQGKVIKKFRPKGLENSGRYFVRDGMVLKVFSTQVEAFSYALPKQLTVYKKEGWDVVAVSLCPITEAKVAKELANSKTIQKFHDDRWNSEWMRRKESENLSNSI